MFKLLLTLFAIIAVAFAAPSPVAEPSPVAAPKPDPQIYLSSPYAYNGGLVRSVSPYAAYSSPYVPTLSAYSAPVYASPYLSTGAVTYV